MLRACAAEEPVDVDVVAAVAREAMEPYASCGPDSPAALTTSGCRVADLDAQSILLATGTPDCDSECYLLLKSECGVFAKRLHNQPKVEGVSSHGF